MDQSIVGLRSMKTCHSAWFCDVYLYAVDAHMQPQRLGKIKVVVCPMEVAWCPQPAVFLPFSRASVQSLSSETETCSSSLPGAQRHVVVVVLTGRFLFRVSQAAPTRCGQVVGWGLPRLFSSPPPPCDRCECGVLWWTKHISSHTSHYISMTVIL